MNEEVARIKAKLLADAVMEILSKETFINSDTIRRAAQYARTLVDELYKEGGGDNEKE